MYCIQGEDDIEVYELIEPFDDDCEPEQEFKGKISLLKVTKGDVIVINSKINGLTFKGEKSNIAFFTITVKKDASFSRPQYCVDSKELLGVISSNHEASRIQVASIALRNLKPEIAAESIEHLSLHPNPYVRNIFM
jgi:hypothetical protein